MRGINPIKLNQPLRDIWQIEKEITNGERPIRGLVLLLAANFGTYDFKKLKPAALALEYINLGTRHHYNMADGNITLIAGDHYYARALSVVAPLKNNEVIRILSQALIDVTEGQVCSVPAELPLERALGQYYEVLRKRCALYEAACDLASLLAEVNESITLVLKEYAVRMGLAYEAQVRREMAKKELVQLVSLAKDTLINLPAAVDYRSFKELADGVVE